MKQHFPEFPEQRTVFTKISVPFDIRLNGLLFRNATISGCSRNDQNFPGNFGTICPLSKFLEAGGGIWEGIPTQSLHWKDPMQSDTSSSDTEVTNDPVFFD